MYACVYVFVTLPKSPAPSFDEHGFKGSRLFRSRYIMQLMNNSIADSDSICRDSTCCVAKFAKSVQMIRAVHALFEFRSARIAGVQK